MIRVYVDTSVVSGCHDDEYQEVCQTLFDKFRSGAAVLVHSELLHRELVRAPQAVRDILAQLPDEAKELTALTNEVVRLAVAYIDAGAIGGEHRADSRHVALATFAKVDILASMNFKHMASRSHSRAYNEVNVRMGYTELRISDPVEIERDGQNIETI